MSAMDGNPYAESLKDFDDPRNSLETAATLALAYEQRTANLIAVLTAGFESVKVAGVDYSELADTIQERLGL